MHSTCHNGSALYTSCDGLTHPRLGVRNGRKSMWASVRRVCACASVRIEERGRV